MTWSYETGPAGSFPYQFSRQDLEYNLTTNTFTNNLELEAPLEFDRKDTYIKEVHTKGFTLI